MTEGQVYLPALYVLARPRCAHCGARCGRPHCSARANELRAQAVRDLPLVRVPVSELESLPPDDPRLSSLRARAAAARVAVAAAKALQQQAAALLRAHHELAAAACAADRDALSGLHEARQAVLELIESGCAVDPALLSLLSVPVPFSGDF